MNPLDKTQSDAHAVGGHTLEETAWNRLIQTGRGLPDHVHASPDASALMDFRLLFAQWISASSRQVIPMGNRSQFLREVNEIMEATVMAISIRSYQLGLLDS